MFLAALSLAVLAYHVVPTKAVECATYTTFTPVTLVAAIPQDTSVAWWVPSGGAHTAYWELPVDSFSLTMTDNGRPKVAQIGPTTVGAEGPIMTKGPEARSADGANLAVSFLSFWETQGRRHENKVADDPALLCRCRPDHSWSRLDVVM
jgi:hypothetical protein